MKTLIVYDDSGYLLSMRSGDSDPREPIGVPFLWVDVPKGKKVAASDEGIVVDTSVTPHQVIFEDVPPSEVDMLRQQVTELQDALVEIADMVAGGAV